MVITQPRYLINDERNIQLIFPSKGSMGDLSCEIYLYLYLFIYIHTSNSLPLKSIGSNVTTTLIDFR